MTALRNHDLRRRMKNKLGLLLGGGQPQTQLHQKQEGRRPLRSSFVQGASWSRNVLLEGKNYVFEGYIFDHSLLVVTFDHAQGNFKTPALFRAGYASNFLRKRRCSHLSIKAKTKDWYQGEGLSDVLKELRENGFFHRFDRVVTYGVSMGGFAAIAFADQVNADTVLALSPQTTLNRELVGWETRFPMARKLDWSGPNNDAVGKSLKARRVICVYDPMNKQDALHIARLTQPNLIPVSAPFLGHGIALPLAKMSALKPLVAFAFDEAPSLAPYYQKLRRRRATKRYYTQMLKMPRVLRSEAMLGALQASMEDAGFSFEKALAKTKKSALGEQTKARGL